MNTQKPDFVTRESCFSSKLVKKVSHSSKRGLTDLKYLSREIARLQPLRSALKFVHPKNGSPHPSFTIK